MFDEFKMKSKEEKIETAIDAGIKVAAVTGVLAFVYGLGQLAGIKIGVSSVVTALCEYSDNAEKESKKKEQ